MSFGKKVNYLIRDIQGIFKGSVDNFTQSELSNFMKGQANSKISGKLMDLSAVKSNYEKQKFEGTRTIVKTFTGASVDRLREWDNIKECVDNELNRDLPILILRCLDLYKNNPIVKTILQIYITEIISTGLKLIPEPLNGDGTINTDLQAEMVKIWERVVEEISPHGSLYQIQPMALTSQILTGASFINFVPSNNPDSLLPIQIQLLDQSQLDENKLSSDTKETVLICGVEVDKKTSLAVKYHFPNNPKNASDIIACFDCTLAGIPVGLPWLHAALEPLFDVDKIIGNIGIIAEIASCIGLWLPPDDNDFEKPKTNTVTELAPGMTYSGSKEPKMISSGGLLPDMIIPTIDLQLHSIASSQGFSHQLLTRSLKEASFSSMRYNSIEDRRFFQMKVNAFASKWLKPLYVKMMGIAVASDKLPISEAEWTRNKFNLTNCRIFNDYFSYLNPLQETQSDVLALENGLLSYQRYYSSRGMDWRKELAQLAIEKKVIEDAGLTKPKLTAVIPDDEEGK